jgi:hypothetical protein
MDSSITIKPRLGVTPRSHALRDPVAVREAIDTELDPAKAVAATADGGTKQNNNGQHHEAAAREVIIDPQGQEALFSAIDVRAEHTEPLSNQALMRQRAYQHHPASKDARTEIPAEDAPASDPHADLEA